MEAEKGPQSFGGRGKELPNREKAEVEKA